MVFVAWLHKFKLKLNKAILASAFKVQTHEMGFVGGGRLCWTRDPETTLQAVSRPLTSNECSYFLEQTSYSLQPCRSHNLILRPLPTDTALTPPPPFRLQYWPRPTSRNSSFVGHLVTELLFLVLIVFEMCD